MTAAREETGNASQTDGTIYTDSHDRQRHRGSMQAIADEMHRPLDEIAELYEEILGQMKATAQIPDYLPVLVSKKVKQMCRQH
ncbi:DUF3562 domain-containing protein [Noviherbaspirillum sp. UKPF54]|uniref:DUF3562 domain-containing protein n=1 Tax=Noviherbaspirillum sp. UKPF54 TaxID=2601898 RepID=UPI0011B1C433|nr:DUF3562 domain-containing protein [Noviherbaspirillum sp. UKPF54]QDZ27097.1 DUF3562 domain-containing protein [Noviherbaspirillum sp. UKPF54]